MLGIKKEDLVCPISREFFYSPVVAEDGFTYEESEIIGWFNVSINKNSPITQKPISTKLIPNHIIRNVVNDYLEKYPEEKKNQYKISREHSNNVETVNKIISNKQNFNRLLEYINFSMEIFLKNLEFDNFLKEASDKIIKHIIDNCIDIEFADENGHKLIHYIIQYSGKRPKIIKYIMDKNVNFEYATKDGSRLIHFLIKYSTPSMIRYIINKDVNLESKTIDNETPLHYMIKYSTPTMIRYLMNKNVNLFCKTKNGELPMHLMARECKSVAMSQLLKHIIDRSIHEKSIKILNKKTKSGFRIIDMVAFFSEKNTQILKFVIDCGVDLEHYDASGDKPIHTIIKESEPEMIKYIINKNVDLETCDSNGNYPIHLIAKYSTPKILKYIIRKGANLESIGYDNKKSIHIIAKYSTFKMIKYVINKNIKLEPYIDKKNKNLLHSVINRINLNKNLTMIELDDLTKYIKFFMNL